MSEDRDKREDQITEVMRPADPPGRRRTQPRLAVSTDQARLVVLEGDLPGRAYAVVDGMLIGRSSEAALRLTSPQVSNRHARILRRPDGEATIEDLGSRNGTIVNGAPVAGQPRTLRFGDRIQLGGKALLLFTYHDPLEEQLHHRQKIEAIGQLAAGIAHDFNNILEAILANLRFVDGLPPETALGSVDVRRCLSDVTAAAERAAELTRRLLNFTRRDPTEDERADLSSVAEQVSKLLSRALPSTIQVETRIAPKLVVDGHHSELEQVLMNLCLNARDAMPAGGILRIEVARASEDALTSVVGAPGRAHVVLVVADTGVGMDERTRGRIFEPFFTTKRLGSGSGLGLAAVYGIVTKHGGRIVVDSEPGRGATFSIYLPEAEPEASAPDAAAARAPAPAAKRGKGLVIVVDDDDTVRRAIQRMLGALGYQVLGASGGLEAISLYEASSPGIRTVLLDVDMPKPDGVETFLRLRQIDPGANVVLMSGYHDPATRERLMSLGAREFLPKPLDLAALDKVLGSDS